MSFCKILPLPEFLLEVVEDDEADGDPRQAARDVGQVGEGRGGGGRVLRVKPPVHSHTHLQRRYKTYCKAMRTIYIETEVSLKCTDELHRK